MTNEQILEGNKLIAEFMGYEIPKQTHKLDWIYYKGVLQNMLFHYSWDWLIPVVGKIESIYDKHHGHFGVHISSNTCSIQGTNLWKSLEMEVDNNESITRPYGYVYCSDSNVIFDTKIESTWYNVVEFIKWYNNYKEK